MSDLLLPHAPVRVPLAGFAIGDAAHACGVTPDTLRYYEREDLLLEPTARDASGRRRYTARDLAWIAGLVMLRETGMPIAGLRRMAELYRTPGADAERLRLLEEHREHVIAEQRRIAQHLEAIEAKIASYRAALREAD
ncbi:MerR family transcriptional regulator [Gryllotalpicola reticulitermitis]|uniref:MerR family transcriptional regulator n=1 Tax=Gryllotalpicola reticulitermitis TaxID=1184153 RepID=A0ABV8Q7G4_9MICO